MIRAALLLLLLPFVTPQSSSHTEEYQQQENADIIDSTATKAVLEAQVDDRTYLDVFGQAAKEYLTTQLVWPQHA